MPTFTINPNGIDKLRQLGLYQSDGGFARSIGVSSATVSRVMKGLQEPGPRVMAGALQAFGQSMFFELFRVQD